MYINMYNLPIFLAFLARIHAKALREILKVSALVANVPGEKNLCGFENISVSISQAYKSP